MCKNRQKVQSNEALIVHAWQKMRIKEIISVYLHSVYTGDICRDVNIRPAERNKWRKTELNTKYDKTRLSVIHTEFVNQSYRVNQSVLPRKSVIQSFQSVSYHYNRPYLTQKFESQVF